MRGHLVAICLLATTLALSVESKPHHEHHALFKSSPVAKDTGAIPEEADAEQQFLPTLDSLDGGSGEPEDVELSANANANANSPEGGVLQAATQRGVKKTTALLLSEEELADLLNKDTDGDLGDEQEVEEEEVDGQEVKADRDPENSEEEEEEEEEDKEGKMMEKHLKMLEGAEVKEQDEENVAMPEEETESVFQTGSAVEEADGSSDSEILADLDYASDADQGVHLRLTDVNSDLHAGEELKGAKLTPTITKGEQGLQIVDAGEREEMADQAQDLAEQSEEQEESKEAQEPKLAEDRLLETPTQSSGEVGEEGPPVQEQENQAEGGDNKTKDAESVSPKGKKRKGLRQRARKHTLQGRDQAGRGQQPTPQPGAPDQTTHQTGAPDQPADSTAPVAKRRRAGKWTPLVGMNPVQIRATVDLYLSNKPSVGGASQKENSSDPCSGFRCKRGKTCKLSADLKPACVCQEPSECPTSLNDFDHVCGTDNKTYDTACELFATKCNLEGTKRGHKLHLDYTGPCKLLPPCLDSELVQFPLRMRDWLKNVLLQLYEHDSISPGFLTAKQRAKVRKIHENEKRLHAGDHPLDLLAQDFEKNYNLYIYPVHWQFAQMDKHPSDRLLSHSELAPLRVPLVPMEHCTSRFFQECDGDRDKQLSFPEWAHCFGIQDADMDVKLLF